MNPTIIILGKNGMLGRYFYTYFGKKSYNIIGTTREDIDLNNIDFVTLQKFLNTFTNHDNVVLINCVGLILPRKSKTEEYLFMNAVLPHFLSIICQYNKWNYIQPSTDCVFNGKKGNYTEDSDKDESYIYGYSKGLGEEITATVIRVSIIGEEIENKYSLIEWVKSNKNKSIKGYTNHYWNGITCLEYCKIVEYIIKTNTFWKGVRNICSTVVNKWELLSIINSVFDLHINIERHECSSTINKTLSTNYNLNIPVSHIKQQIEELKEYKF